MYNGCGGGGGLEVVVDGADDEVDEAFMYCSTWVWDAWVMNGDRIIDEMNMVKNVWWRYEKSVYVNV